MFNFKSMIMQCGHPPDCMMPDVPYGRSKINVAACSHCFDHFGHATQKACVIRDRVQINVELPNNTLRNVLAVATLTFIIATAYILSILPL